mgnify:FL=1
MNAKKMEEMYVYYGLDEETRNMFAAMRRHDLISYDAWNRFYERCKDLEFGEVDGVIIHGETGRAVYVMDNEGVWHKVK